MGILAIHSLLCTSIVLLTVFKSLTSAEILGFNGTESYEIGENRLEHLTIDLEAISPEHASFVVVQAHSQKYSFTASLSDRIAYDNSLNKTNPGFVAYYESSSLEGATNLYLSSDGSVARQLVQAMAVAYPHFAPVPGGCCQTCNIPIDPSLNVTFNPWYTKIRFQLANSGYNPLKTNLPLCESRYSNFLKLTYQLYLYRFGEMSYSEELAMEAWQKMATVDELKSHGSKVGSSLSATDIKLVTVSSEPGQGVIYNILVEDPDNGEEAVYVPFITYGCSFTAKVDGCDAAGSIATKVFLCIGGTIGLIFCFFGHRLFILETFVTGFLYVSFFTFVMLSNYVDWTHDDRLGASCGLGIVGGILFFLVFFRFYFALAFVLLSGIVLGFLVSSALFFTPFGDLSPWQTLMNFWIAFVCGTLIPVVLLLMWPRTLNVVTTAVVGSYAFVVGVNSFVHGVLSYIVLNIIKKAVTPEDIKAYTDFPFETPDIILASVWVFLSLNGTAFQLWRERKANRPALPPPPYEAFLLWRRRRQRHRLAIQSRNRARTGERRRLMETAGSGNVASYGSLSDTQ